MRGNSVRKQRSGVFAQARLRAALTRARARATQSPVRRSGEGELSGDLEDRTHLVNDVRERLVYGGALGPGWARLPGGREPDPALIDAAMGGEHTDRSDAAWWHYQDHTAPERHVMSSLWAECSVSDMPEIEGVRVLVLWPPILGARHWGASFFGPALAAAPPEVVIERELEPAEVEAWFARIGIAP